MSVWDSVSQATDVSQSLRSSWEAYLDQEKNGNWRLRSGPSKAHDLFHHMNESFIGNTERKESFSIRHCSAGAQEGQTSLESWELLFSQINKDMKQALRPATAQTEPFETCEQPVSKGKINLAQTRLSSLLIVCRTLMLFQQWMRQKNELRSRKCKVNLCLY